MSYVPTEKPIELITNYKDVLRVCYMVSNVCNYKCVYCFDGSNEGTVKFRKDWQLIANNFNHLFDHYKATTNKKRFDVQLVGGEPSMWSNLPEFCSAIKSRHNVSIMVVSNGSRTLRWWKESAHLYDHVQLSCHHADVDLEHFINVADTLYELNVVVTVLVMMDPKAWDKCVDIVDKLKQSKRRWAINLQKLESNSTYPIVYTEEQSKWIEENTRVRYGNPFYLIRNMFKAFIYQKEPKAVFPDGKKKNLTNHVMTLNNWNHFNGWECNLGVDSIFIPLDGSVTGTCLQKLYGKDFYYNIYDENFVENFKPEIKPVTCRQLGCYCVAEINLTKKKAS